MTDDDVIEALRDEAYEVVARGRELAAVGRLPIDTRPADMYATYGHYVGCKSGLLPPTMRKPRGKNPNTLLSAVCWTAQGSSGAKASVNLWKYAKRAISKRTIQKAAAREIAGPIGDVTSIVCTVYEVKHG